MKTERIVHDTAPPTDVSGSPQSRFSRMELLTEAQIRAMPESDYMNDLQLAFFRERLSRIERELLENGAQHGEAMREHEQAADPVDRASQEETHSLGLLTRVRETRLYTETRQAIARIDSGDYGYCAETGEPIGIPRLLAQPTATMTVDAQDRLEKRLRTYAQER